MKYIILIAFLMMGSLLEFQTEKIADQNYKLAIYTGGAVNRDHKGIDISGTWRARILAIADGVVIDNYYPPDDKWKGHPVYGGMIRVLHADGRIVLYAHLSATYVNETTKRFVTQGQVIGRMGNTGISAGQHLHIEIHEPSGTELQPLKYIGGLE
jgi:murein DD-endopeptidase MepM/ murein hydrolase activator NlpD